MKLNKNGWGFAEFFAFLIIFVICLLITGFGLRKLGLLDEDWHFVKLEDLKKEEKPVVTYASLREDMVSATMKYIEKYYKNDLRLDTLNIRVSQLKNEEFLEKFEDADGNACSGYVAVYYDDQNRVQYDPYLKCKKFETTGYEARKDD